MCAFAHCKACNWLPGSLASLAQTQKQSVCKQAKISHPTSCASEPFVAVHLSCLCVYSSSLNQLVRLSLFSSCCSEHVDFLNKKYSFELSQLEGASVYVKFMCQTRTPCANLQCQQNINNANKSSTVFSTNNKSSYH